MINTNLQKALDEIKKCQNELNFLIASKGVIINIEIDNIPETWEKFPNSENDMWRKLPIFSDAIEGTACLYLGRKGSKFPAHKHIFQSEVFSIENEKGRIRIITKTYDKEIGYGDVIMFDKDEPHIAIFLTETLILCRWKPRFKDDKWNASYLEAYSEND